MVQAFTRRTFLALGAVALGGVSGLAAVFGSGSSRTRQGDQRIALGELTLSIRADPWRMAVLGPAGAIVWEEPADQSLSYTLTDGQICRAQRLASMRLIGSAGDTECIVETDDPSGGVIVLDVEQLGPRLFRLTITPDTPEPVSSLSGAVITSGDERFVGFGERFEGVNQRGQKLDMWAEDRRLANYGSSTYAPVPLLLSNRGYGFGLERFERSRFDLAATRSDRWTWEQDAPAVSIAISYGPSLKELISQNAALSGLPPLPPPWLFGVWKTSVGGQDQVIDEARKLRDLHVPISAVFSYDAVDADANLGWPSVAFAGRKAGPYPDPQTYTRTLHDLGLKALNYFTPDFHVDRPNYQEPASHGFLVRRDDGRIYIHPTFQEGWLDYSDADAVGWWGAAWRRALSDLGYDGGMLDLGELLPADAWLADGTTGLQTHNRYPLLYAQAAWQHASSIRPDGDFALVLRSGAMGAQRFQSAQWNGDARMRWEAPDGLQSMIPAGLSFGLSGFPYWHTEVAGYLQADLSHEAERELWLRWLQLATWTSLLRDHLGEHQRSPIDVWLDDGTLDAFQKAARVHADLFPYLYSVAVEATQTGLPIMRYLPLEVPGDPRAWDEQQSYFLGPTFLVAPVVEPGATSRSVYLPGGEWVDYWQGTLYEGGRDVTVAAPLDAPGPPVFARAGALIPLAAEHDSLVRAASADVRTWSGDLVVRVIPAGQNGPRESSFTLYDGTRLHWTGSALEVQGNLRPRGIELRTPDDRVVIEHVDGSSAIIS